MRRVNTGPTLTHRLLPSVGLALAAVVLGAGLTVAAKRYAPPPRAVAPMIAALHHDFVRLTAASGLRLENLIVDGRNRTSPEDLLAAVNAGRGTSILSIDVAEARAAIESLPWVKAARVERQLPDTLHVTLQEREPFALWQQGARYTLVDRDGTPIVAVPSADPALRLIVGPDAPAHAADLFNEMEKAPDLAARVRAAVRVSGRRWNVYFNSVDGGVAVRLPEEDLTGAWARLATLERDDKILERDIEFVDLRLPDRLIVRLRKEAEPTDKPQSKRAVPDGLVKKVSNRRST